MFWLLLGCRFSSTHTFQQPEGVRRISIKSSLPPPVTLMMIVDVLSLYTNLTHTQVSIAQKLPILSSLYHRFHFSCPVSLNPHPQLLSLQIKGTAMETRMVSSYVNLFIGILEEDFQKCWVHQPDLWFRFVFLFWPCNFPRVPQYSLSCRIHIDNLFAHITFLMSSCILKSFASHVIPCNHNLYLHFSNSQPHPQKAL